MFASQKQVFYETPSSMVYERKFDTALRDTTIKAFVRRWEQDESTTDDRYILESEHIEWPDIVEPDPCLYAKFLKFILTQSKELTQFGGGKASWSKTVTKLVNNVIDVQVNYMLSQSKLPNLLNLTAKFEDYKRQRSTDLLVDNLATVAGTIGDMVDKINRIKRPEILKMTAEDRIDHVIAENYWVCPHTSLEMVWSERLVALKWDDQWSFHPRPYFLMIHNKLCDLLSVLFYSKAADGNALETGSYRSTILFVGHLADLCITYGNQFFEIAKSLEAICIGETLAQVEQWDNYDFLSKLCQALRTKIKYQYHGSLLESLMRRASIPLKHEYAGLSKIMGHPYVDMAEGTRKLYEKTTEPLFINPDNVRLCTLYIKQNFIKNYLVRHGKWPQVEIAQGCPHALIQASMRNLDPDSVTITSHYGHVTIEGYAFLNLLPCMQFEKLENYIPYLKDKTITILRQGVLDTFLEREETGKGKFKGPKWQEMRLLLVFLLNPTILTDHVPFLDKYTNCQDLTMLMDYLVIRVVPKEKELKIDYRGFGCKTYMDRARALAQEKNAKLFEELYTNESAMAIGELDLNRKLMAFRRILKAYTGYKVIRINVDASSWNNRFRDETVRPVMRETLDRVFNYPIFSKTHEAFQDTLFYVEDEIRPAKWEGQAGGIEGLNQDTWVVTYIGQIKVALEKYDFQYHVLCKGDDLRVIVLIPPSYHERNSIKELKDQLLESIKVTGASFGHTIKVDDSYGSEHYFAFSKSASVGTIELPQVYRKVQKCYGANNAFLPSLDEYVGATFSNAHSASRTSVNPIACYSVALYWFYFYLSQTTWYSDLTDNQYMALALAPSLVGGFPIIFLHNMFVRAESDLLAPFIGIILFCDGYRPPLARILRNFLRIAEIGDGSIKALLKDPYCLNTLRPMLPGGCLRQNLLPVLKTIAKNEQVVELFKANIQSIMKSLHECFSSFETYNPRVMAAIYAATPEGIIDQLLRKFETARSIQELLILRWGRGRTNKILRRVISKERQVQMWRCNRLQGKHQKRTFLYSLSHDTCPAAVAEELRKISWGKTCEGVTMPPMQHLLYFTTPHLAAATEDNWSLGNHFVLRIKDITQSLQEGVTRAYSTSDCKAFLGHTTSPGTIEPLMQFVEKDVILLQLKNLLELRTWTAKASRGEDGVLIESNIEQLIDCIIRFYADQDINQIAPFAGQHKSGTMTHHIRAPAFRESIVPNELSNIYQQVVGESNAHIKFRTSSDHFTVNFLHVLCYMVKMSFLELEFSSTITTPSPIWAVTTPCGHCSKPIKETPLRFDPSCLPLDEIKPLRATRVGQASSRVLLDSYTAFLELDYRTDFGDSKLSFEEALSGVMQMACDYYVRQRHLVQDRFSHHAAKPEQMAILMALAPKGRSKEIGQREMKYAPIALLCESFVTQVYLCLITRYPNVTLTNVTQICTETPGSELPWYGLVDFIYRSGRLGEILRELSRIAMLIEPSSSCNVAAASQSLGPICYICQWKQKTIPRLMILSYYKKDNLFNHVKPVVIGVQWAIFNQELKALLRGRPMMDPVTNIIDMEHRYSIDHFTWVLMVYILFTLPIMDDDYRQDVMLKLEEATNVEIQVLTTAGYDNEMLPAPTAMEDAIEYKNMVYCMEKRPHIAWEACYEASHLFWNSATEKLERLFNKHKVRCRYSDPNTCILIARAQNDPVEKDSSSDYQVPRLIGPRKTMSDIQPQLASTNHWKPRKETGSSLIKPSSLDDLEWPTIDPKVDPSCLFTLFSSTNVAACKIAEIWSLFSLYPSIPAGSNIACLADGIGGFTDFLARLTHQSLFITCCLPEESSVEVKPESAMSTIQKHGHRVQYGHILSGVSDLNDSRTLEYLERFSDDLCIVTCDADAVEYNTPNRSLILQNVATYYLRKRAKNGILIMKCYLRETGPFKQAVSLLARYSNQLYVVRLGSSRISDEHYIIAQGTGPMHETLTYKTKLPEPSSRFDKDANEYIRKFHSMLTKKLKDHDFMFTGGSGLGNRFSRLAQRLEPICSALLTHQLGILTVPKNLKTIFTRCQTVSELKSFKFLDNKSIMGTWKDRLHQKNVQIEKGQAWDSDTVTHMIRIAEKWFTQAGFEDGKQLWKDLPSDTVIAESQIRVSYVKRAKQTPRRLQLIPVSRSHFESDFSHLGQRCFTFSEYVWGIELSMIVYNTWLYTQAHQSVGTRAISRQPTLVHVAEHSEDEEEDVEKNPLGMASSQDWGLAAKIQELRAPKSRYLSKQ